MSSELSSWVALPQGYFRQVSRPPKKRILPRPEKSSLILLTNHAYKCKMHIDAIPVFERGAYRCEKLEMNRVDELLIVGSDKTRKERKLQWLRIQ
jgi:hypothetical protein